MKNYGNSEKVSGCQGLGRGDKYMEHRGFFRALKQSAQYSNGGCIPSYICQNAQNVRHLK